MPLTLLSLPDVLQLEVAKRLSEPSDCGALCIAIPSLGLVALRELERFKHPLVSVAMRIGTGKSLLVDEALMRRYMWEEFATEDGCAWLTKAAEESGLRIVCTRSQSGRQQWLLHRAGDAAGALVRLEEPGGTIRLFEEGESNAERLVIQKTPGDRVIHYAPSRIVYFKDAEAQEHAQELVRKVREELADGTLIHYEGEWPAARKVREEFEGSVCFFEGRAGYERMVRAQRPDGCVTFYQGRANAERMVREEWPDGSLYFFEGSSGEERVVREEWPDGSVYLLEGKKGAERIVCLRLRDSAFFFKGAKGMERKVREVNQKSNAVLFYEGKKGEERIVRMERSITVVTHFEGEAGSERGMRK
jgi:hypothetical protein